MAPYRIVKKLIFLLFLAGCQNNSWQYHQVNSKFSCFSSKTLTLPTDQIYCSVDVQFMKGSFGTLCFLSCRAKSFISSTVGIQIQDDYRCFSGIIMEGAGRMLLPNEATELLLSALSSGQAPILLLDGFSTQLSPF